MPRRKFSTTDLDQRQIKLQTRREKNYKSSSCPQYKFFITSELPNYLQSNNKYMQMMARFRIGNEEYANQYWKSEAERRCRICGRGSILQEVRCRMDKRFYSVAIIRKIRPEDQFKFSVILYTYHVIV